MAPDGGRRLGSPETRVRVIRHGVPALRDAGLGLRDVLDARTLAPAGCEPPRALFVAVKER